MEKRGIESAEETTQKGEDYGSTTAIVSGWDQSTKTMSGAMIL
jgi:hypothetical protein